VSITQNVRQLLAGLPEGILVVAAVKSREPREILEAIEAGIGIIGGNYVQETEKIYREIGAKVQYHFIGHLQKNKVKKAVEIFDMIETVDSIEIAAEIDKRCAQSGREMPVLIEINSGREPQKSGVYPENAPQLITQIAALEHVRVMGLMTMGSLTDRPQDSRPYFIETKKVFDRMKNAGLPRVEMKYLSMGMTDSYEIALEEGANTIRIGRKIFGERS
jgi:pyridoxal phosphate enzyme (YggS family)